MSFFGMGVWEIMVIMVIALIIFGPGRLPEIGAQVGRAVKDFRSATKDLTGEFQKTMSDVESVADEVRQSAQEVHDTTRDMGREMTDEMKTLDQEVTAATKPAKPAKPAKQTPKKTAPKPVTSTQTYAATNGAGTGSSSRVPSKADPLADLMSVESPPSASTNGHSNGNGSTRRTG